MAAQLFADWLLVNGRVLTVDSRQPQAEACAVRNGKFAAVGSSTELRALAGPATEVLDLAGRTVVPGFIDAHVHVLSSGVLHLLAADCTLPSVAAVLQALRERAARTPEGGWVRGFQFDDTKMAEQRHLTRADLDSVSTRHGIFVEHRGGHTSYVNSLALRLAGLSRETPDPSGGRLERDARTGELTGVLHEKARELLGGNLLPKPTAADYREGLRLICRMFNRSGLTSVHDACVTPSELRIYQEGCAEGELTLRTYTLIEAASLERMRSAGLRTGFGNEMLRLGGIKFFTDGAIAGRTAYLSEPYVGSQERGILAFTAEELYEPMRCAHEAGFQLCTHANGDAAIEMTLDLYEKILAAHPRPDARPRIEHCTVVNARILERMRKLGCIATPFCTYVYFHGEKMKFYGAARLERMFAQRSFLDHGIVSTGATDYPPGPFEPLLGIQSCVTRTDHSGTVWGPSQRISVEEALRLYTQQGAYASFEEDLKGSITPGKLADFVVLGANPMSVDPQTIKDIPVEMTVLGGKVVFDARA